MTPTVKAALAQTTPILNQNLMAQLWPQLKLYGKKSNVKVVKCGWRRGRKLTFFKTEVAQLRDVVLSQMVETAVHPLVEYQADPTSFAWRPHRCASQAARYVACQLEQLYEERPRVMRVELEDCFDKLRHETILDSYPLSAAYRPFSVSFITAPRRGLATPQMTENKYRARKRMHKGLPPPPQVPETTWRPASGVLLESVLGKAIVNNALDGLEVPIV